MLPAMSHEEILRELLDQPRRAYVPMPDLQVIERPGWWQLVTPSVKGGGFNEVSLARGVDDATLDATIAGYRERGCKFVWRVGPDSDPDLVERLRGRGLEHVESVGMARSTAIDPPGLRVDAVDASNVDLYTQTMARGWEIDAAQVAPANRLALASPRHRMYLAYCDGVPVATAGAVLFERSAYLLGGVTLPAFRGRGTYRALVAARLADARARGIELAISIARASTSAPILAKLGFVEICRFDGFTG